MLAHVDGDGDELLGVGADDLLHDGRQVVVLRLSDDVQQLEGDLADLRLYVVFGNLILNEIETRTIRNARDFYNLKKMSWGDQNGNFLIFFSPCRHRVTDIYIKFHIDQNS